MFIYDVTGPTRKRRAQRARRAVPDDLTNGEKTCEARPSREPAAGRRIFYERKGTVGRTPSRFRDGLNGRYDANLKPDALTPRSERPGEVLWDRWAVAPSE